MPNDNLGKWLYFITDIGYRANDHMAPNVGRHILADSAQLAGFSSGIPDTTPAHLILGEGLWLQSINKWVAGPEETRTIILGVKTPDH